MALFRRGSDPVVSIEPDPLRTSDDAYETGLMIGLTGSAARGIAAKNMADRLALWGRQQLGQEAGPRAAGKAAGKRAGRPADGQNRR